MPIGYIYIFFAEMTINILCQFLIFFIVELCKFFMHSRYQLLVYHAYLLSICWWKKRGRRWGGGYSALLC